MRHRYEDMKTYVRLILALVACVPLLLAQETKDAKQPIPTPGISVIKFVPPVYPPIARTAGISGDVRLFVEIGPDGSPTQVTVLSGHPILKQSAVDAVRQ